VSSAPRSKASGTPKTLPEHAPTILGGIRHLVGGKYRLEERLGEGTLGVVHRAVHLGLEKSFAIKLLKTGGAPSPVALARFQKEALALGRLQHPHIVQVTDSGIDETGVPYLVMELLEGVPLSEICRQQGPLPLAKALPLLEQIAGTMDAAHGAGVLHRDLKPGNVLVASVGAAGVKVLDFGLAEWLAQPGETAEFAESPPETAATDGTGALHGTPLYAAPELIRGGEASRASDIYSFGVLAYELLGGKPPFQGTMAEVLTGHLEREPPPLPLPPEVWQALQNALRKDPALRPPTASGVVRGLREGAARAERARWKATEIPRRIRLAALLAAALLAVGLVLPWPPFAAIESLIGDLRVQTSPVKAPDPRILLITFDEPSLDSSPLSLADRADEIGRDLSRILDAGARGVALDFLPHEKWSASPGFSELLLRHSEKLTLAAFSASGGDSVAGPECVDALTMAALGPRRASGLFGFVNPDEDRDGVVRRGRLWFRERAGGKRPSWAARAARGLRADLVQEPQSFWIDTRIDWPRYARISWRQVPTALDRSPGLFRDQLVLLGGDFRGSGDDYHRIPHRSGRNTAVSNLTLQALMVDTIGAGLLIHEPGKTPVLMIAALGAALAMAGVLCARRAGPVVAWAAVGAVLYLATSFPVFWWAGLMFPITAPLCLLGIGLFTALILRRNLPSPPEVSIE
jgi:serine/threonine protein kinase